MDGWMGGRKEGVGEGEEKSLDSVKLGMIRANVEDASSGQGYKTLTNNKPLLHPQHVRHSIAC